jgi:hypothetical protein
MDPIQSDLPKVTPMIATPQLRNFPKEFSSLLSPRGLRLLNGKSQNGRALFKDSATYFANFSNLIKPELVDDCISLMDKHLYPCLSIEQRKIPPESITKMKVNYEERLTKTMHIKTAFFRRRDAKSYRAAEKIGLLQLMNSESFVAFAEAVTGFKLKRDWSIQVTCYEHGDYAGPHNDHHPEENSFKDGFIDVHVMFANKAVDHHYLVYEQNGHFSKIVNINTRGGISVYKLPFWHYTTPLAGKPGRETEARRWLLLGTFDIDR